MNAFAEQQLRALQTTVAEAQGLMEVGGWQEAEEKLAPALVAFGSAGLVLEPEHEWLRICSLHAECLFWRGEFEQAHSIFEAASQSRKKAGIFDWEYIRQRRYMALSLRGLCDFKRCLAILADARSTATRNQIADVLRRLDSDIQTTEDIRNDVYHNVAFAPQKIRLVGRDGVEILGGDRIALQGYESLNYNCVVSECRLTMDQPFRMRVQLRFSVDNDVPILNGPIADGYPGCRTPILFGFLLPKGAAVHYGDFSLELNDPSLDWKESFFFLQNRFTTLFHPASYPPYGFYPIPRCKTYRYVRADFSFFRCPLPRKAEVAFAGNITFPARWAGHVPGHIELAVGILLPYKMNTFRWVRGGFSLEGFNGGQMVIARSGYIADRANYRPGVTPLAPEEGLQVGPSTPLDSAKCAAQGCSLAGSEFLTISLRDTLNRGLAVSLQRQAHVIPTGAFDYVTRPQRRSPKGGISLGDETVEPVPLLDCILLNAQSCFRSVELTTCCKLFPPAMRSVNVPPSGISIVSVRPAITSGETLFPQQGERDYDAGPVQILATVIVRERLSGTVTAKRIDERSIQLNALPPDYMVWAIANRAEGRLLNLRRLIARWVTPDAPAIKNFVGRLQHFPLQNNTPHFDVELKGAYEALRSHGFDYDTERVNFGTTMEHDFQRVRLPSKSLAHRQINCIDGTVLLASVIEVLGYRPAVVFIPGHAFLAVLFGDDLNKITRMLFLESTGLCQAAGSSLSYEEASRAGLAQFSKHRESLIGTSRDVTRFEIVPIEQSRAEGIEGFRH